MVRLVALVFVVFGFVFLASAEEKVDGRAYGENVQLRGTLVNSRIQFEQAKAGTVAFLGGSITEMNGYRPMVMEVLKRRFPATMFKFVNAGVSSTTSTTGAFRLEHDVLAEGPVDLLFVEFAVNDDQDGHHTRTECIRAMEGIIRHARKSNPNMDIVLTYFVNEGMLKDLQGGKVPLTIEAHETVAKHYGISSIHLAKEVAQEITAGSLTWQAYGGVHPAPAGNAIPTKMIDELFNRAWAVPLPLKSARVGSAMPSPLDLLNYENGRFIDPSKAVIKKGFTFGVPDWKSIAGGKRERFTSIPMLSATEAGAGCALRFEGTLIGAYIVAGPDAGMVEVIIDDAPLPVVNLYQSYSSGLHYPCTVIFGRDLKPGEHKLELKISDATKGKGNAARIIQFVGN